MGARRTEVQGESVARIRSIKPEFFTSEQIAECSTSARLLFIGMWCFCDDHGIHPASYARLKMEVMPADDITQKDIGKLVDELIKAGLIKEYEVEGKSYWLVTGWKHQKIDRPNFKYPMPLGHVEHDESSSSARLQLDEDSTNVRRAIPPGEERKGRDVEGKGEKTCPSPDGDGLVLTGSTEDRTGIPYAGIVGLYNRLLVKLAKVRDVTSDRRTAIRTAWQASPKRQSLQFWEAYFDECAGDDFLNGTGPYTNGHEKWRPDFDYLIRSKTVTKVFEKAMHRLEQQRRVAA